MKECELFYDMINMISIVIITNLMDLLFLAGRQTTEVGTERFNAGHPITICN